MIKPSKVISEQYQNAILVKKDGESVTGRIVDENDQKIALQPSPLSSDRIEIKKSEISERRPSQISPMPDGLLDQLTQEEILDLLAYIESTGKERRVILSQSRENRARKQNSLRNRNRRWRRQVRQTRRRGQRRRPNRVTAVSAMLPAVIMKTRRN